MSNQSLREAAQQALDAMCAADERFCVHDIQSHTLVAAIESLRTALAQPDDKAQPVAWRVRLFNIGIWTYSQIKPEPPADGNWLVEPLYAAPQQAAEQVKAQPVAWIERWYGSGPERGWHIYEGRTRIASFGPDIDSSVVSAIVLAHNGAAPQPTAKQGAELSDYLPLPKHLHTAGYLAKSPPLYTADQMRAYVDADRAARGGAA